MAITTLSGYAAAPKQTVIYQKTSGISGVSTQGYWGITGSPAAGSLSIGDTSHGLVPTSATTGASAITAFSGSGYVTNLEVSSATVGMRGFIYDRLFHCGSYTTNGGLTTLSSQPSFSSRIPNGTDYTGLQLWVETNTGVSVTSTVTVTYTDQSGNTGHTTGAIAIGTPAGSPGIMTQLPLASGDCGIQKIESVTWAAASNSGSGMNIMILRPIAALRIGAPPVTVLYPLESLGMPQIWSDSCLFFISRDDTTGSPNFLISLEVASG